MHLTTSPSFILTHCTLFQSTTFIHHITEHYFHTYPLQHIPELKFYQYDISEHEFYGQYEISEHEFYGQYAHELVLIGGR